MKKAATLMSLVLLFATTTLFAQSGKLSVTITGIDPDYEGEVRVTIFTGEEGFPNDYEHGLTIKSVKITTQTEVTVEFELPYGEYAVAVLHDEDGDHVMDYNWVGIPTEGWVCSNEVFPSLRSPYFSESKFNLRTANHAMSLEIDY